MQYGQYIYLARTVYITLSITSYRRQQLCPSPASWHELLSLITGIWFLYTTQRDAGLLDTVCSHPVASSVSNPKCTGPSADSNLIFPSDSESPSRAPKVSMSLFERLQLVTVESAVDLGWGLRWVKSTVLLFVVSNRCNVLGWSTTAFCATLCARLRQMS
jgi:hypothetical protein